jgi:hypothetical protein
VYVDGDIANATIVASGAGTVYVLGIDDTAVVNLAGSTTAVIQANNSVSHPQDHL